MKKIVIFPVITMIAIPAFAKDAKTADVKLSSETITAESIKVDSNADIKEIKTNTEIKSETITESKPVKSETKFPNGLQFGLGVSATSGINGFIGYENKNFDSFWWKRIGGRLDFATTSPIKSTINSAINNAISDGADVGDGLTIDNATLSADHFAALVDIYPFGDTWFLGGWRLTGGYMLGKINLSAKLSGEVTGAPGESMEFELNDQKYRYDGNTIEGTANANWKYSGPYVGTGFDLGLFWGVKIYMDAGVVFTNKTPQLSLDVPINNQLQHWNGATWDNVQLDSSLTAQFENNKALALNDANEEMKKLEIFPIVKLGFMYRF